MAFPNELSEDPKVYSPQEDTWFFTDILESQFMQPLNQLRPLLVCEIGVGSGFISIFLAKKFPQNHFIGTDLSPHSAIYCYKIMSKQLKRNQFDVMSMNLLRGLNPLAFHPDIIFFNPPYVRTGEEEMKKGFFERSWAGGPSGLVVIQEFLEDLSRFSFGNAFFLSSIHNKNELLKKGFHEIFEFQVIAERKIEDERLLCYKVWFKKNSR